MKFLLLRPGMTREKTNLQKTGGGTTKGKRPAWDLKGRLEDMEKMFDMTNARIEDLEAEKKNLLTDVEVKKEVVVQSSEEIRTLRSNIERSEQELENLRKSLREKEEHFINHNGRTSSIETDVEIRSTKAVWLNWRAKKRVDFVLKIGEY